MGNKYDKWEKWKELRDEIKRRFTEPWYEPYFVFYLIVVVIIIGGAGVIASFFDSLNSGSWDGFTKSIGTYYFAIIGAALVEFKVAEELNKESPDRTFFLIAFLLFIVSGGFLAWIYLIGSNWAFLPAILGLLLGLCIWIFSNADEKTTKPKTSDTTGGDANKPLSGTTEGFEVGI